MLQLYNFHTKTDVFFINMDSDGKLENSFRPRKTKIQIH